MLPLLLDSVNNKKLSLGNLCKLTALNPARIFSIKNKGRIAEGFDADVTIVDMEKKSKINNDDLYTKCKWSPFSGMLLKGWPVYTLSRGNIVFDNQPIENEGREVEYFF